MIHLNLAGVRWGTDPCESRNPDGTMVSGRQINVLDEQSGITVTIPFTGDALGNLIGELAQGLTDDQRRELAPTFLGGVVLPGTDGIQIRGGSNPAFRADPQRRNGGQG